MVCLSLLLLVDDQIPLQFTYLRRRILKLFTHSMLQLAPSIVVDMLAIQFLNLCGINACLTSDS